MNSKLLENCRLCGHRCGVNRLKGQRGKCRAGLVPEVASFCVHRGEEPPISGEIGSGTIFFSHCSLRCVFCQNHEISQGEGAGELAQMMLELQSKGVHNINLVSPTHYGPQIIEALATARDKGLKLPIVYNTGGYDSPELLKELKGKVDVYLPDLKYFSNENARKYSGADKYVETARAAVAEMFRQVGPEKLIVRHLVLPNGQAHSFEVLDYVASLSKDIWVSIMSQYSPQHHAKKFPELNRKLLPAEYQEVIDHAEELGLRNLYVQELSSSDVFLPNFQAESPF